MGGGEDEELYTNGWVEVIRTSYGILLLTLLGNSWRIHDGADEERQSIKNSQLWVK